jgi:mannose-6-phosphate isomerase-like protein (cupin superfamily)
MPAEEPIRAPIEALLLPAGEGRTILFGGATIAFKAVGAETGGAWTLFEYTAPPNFPGPPPHWHARTQEVFWVLRGVLRVRAGERQEDLAPGGFLFVPPGVVHGFANPSPEPVTFLVWMSPAGFETYFDELAALMQAEPTWPPADMAKVQALWTRYDMYRE